MRIAQLVVIEVHPASTWSRWPSCPRASAVRRGFGSSGVGSSSMIRAEPRIRVSALLRWGDGILLCRHEKKGKDVWLLPGGGVHSGETLMDALEREIARGGGDRAAAVRGPDRARRLDRAEGHARRRSTSSTSSSPATSTARSSRSPRRTRPCAATGSSRSTSSTASSSTRRSSASCSAGSRAIRRSILERCGPREGPARPHRRLRGAVPRLARRAAGPADRRRSRSCGRRSAGRCPSAAPTTAQVVAELIEAAEPGIMAMPSGRFFGFVIGGALPAALAADWLTSTWDQNAGLYVADARAPGSSRRSRSTGCASCSGCRRRLGRHSSPAARWRT